MINGVVVEGKIIHCSNLLQILHMTLVHSKSIENKFKKIIVLNLWKRFIAGTLGSKSPEIYFQHD